MVLPEILWIVTAATTSAVACPYGVLAAQMWLRSRMVLGPLPSEAHEALRRLLEVSRQGDGLKLTRITLFYVGIGALVVTIAARAWLGIVVTVAPFIIIAWMDVRTTTAPVVLILGTSTHSSIRRQRTIKRKLSPLRVVSLLDVDVPWDTSLSNEMSLDCFRTTNEDDWWLVITKLMKIAPILAIDAAAETAGVLREGRHILGADLWRKCLFLTPPDGSAPVLDRLLPVPGVERKQLKLVPYEGAARACTTMVAELGRYQRVAQSERVNRR